MVGGTLTAGPADGGGFAVDAELPDQRSGGMTITRRRRRRPGDRPRGFAALLGTQPDFHVVGTAADGEEAVELCARGASARRADGRAHAGHGRHRGDAARDVERQAPATRDRPDDVRPRRVRLRRARRRRERLPAQGRDRRHALRRRARRRGRRRAARADRHPPPRRASSRACGRRCRAGPTRCPSSRRARPRCCGWWPKACRTARSPSGSS